MTSPQDGNPHRPAPARSPVARYKDLCIDAADPRVAGPFWASVLGLALEYQDNGDAALAGSAPQQRVWINRVPEPRTVKQRVHLDVLARSEDEVAALGAGRLEVEDHWTVMADPEGGEFCVFVRDELPAYRLYELVVDCVDPGPITRWWADVLGGTMVEDPRGFAWVEAIPGAPFVSMDFVPVPEPKTVKNRIHWDVSCASVQALVAAGATVLAGPNADARWTVLADPEGNEFCAFEGG